MNNTSKLLGLGAFLVASTIMVSGPARAETIQLGFALDESNSISSSDWTIITGGLSAALGAIPVGGPDTYEVSVVKFSGTSVSGTAESVYTGAITSLAARLALQSAVSGATQVGGWTCISCGANLLTTNFNALNGLGDKAIMNISTDGVPNKGVTNGTTLQTSLVGAGWDAISAEAIGSFDQTFLNNLVYPQPAFDTSNSAALPNPLTQGFVLQIASAADYPGAINAKIQNIVNKETPLPGALPMFVSGLGAVGGLLWRRKRKARAATA